MKPKQQRCILIFIGMLFLMGGVALISYNFRTNIVFFYSPTELQTHIAPIGHIIRIGGLIKKGSVQKHEGGQVTEFILTDMKSEVQVRFTGLLPALFREGQGMVAKGQLKADGFFAAEELLAKHDENYMPQEVADALKKSGYWHSEAK